MDNKLELNAQTLELELEWFSAVLNTRLKMHFNQPIDVGSIYEIQPPDLTSFGSVYSELVRHYNFNFEERIILILALVPHIRPDLLDVLFTKNKELERGFAEFGGLKGHNHGGFLPTGETAVFILSGHDLSLRFKMLEYFNPTHLFFKHSILGLDDSRENEPFLSGSLYVTSDYISLLTVGSTTKPNYSARFPARLITTELTWDDLILEDQLREEIGDLQTWINRQSYIMNDLGLSDKLKPGYRALFYGPPGTGKTLTACLLGKATGLDVYKIDLSQIVSKWVGETEKNLAKIFDFAENKNWILFFDEADALFGKRGETKSSQDRYANQEVAYLLQRTETYNGVVIMASNLRNNMDDAFSRRLQSVIYFPMPKPKERLKIWQNVFSGNLKTDENVDLSEIAKKYEISGGGIINVLKYCAIKTLQKEKEKVTQTDIENGIKRELSKEGRTA